MRAIITRATANFRRNDKQEKDYQQSCGGITEVTGNRRMAR